MKIEAAHNCPIDKMNPCKKLDCAWFMKVKGIDPNNGGEIDNWGCSMSWIPSFVIENSQQQKQTGVAIESFRVEISNTNQSNTEFLKPVKVSNVTPNHP